MGKSWSPLSMVIETLSWEDSGREITSFLGASSNSWICMGSTMGAFFLRYTYSGLVGLWVDFSLAEDRGSGEDISIVGKVARVGLGVE